MPNRILVYEFTHGHSTYTLKLPEDIEGEIFCETLMGELFHVMVCIRKREACIVSAHPWPHPNPNHIERKKGGVPIWKLSSRSNYRR